MALATDVNDMSDYSFIECSFTSPPTIPPSFRLNMTSKLASEMFPVVDEEFVANHPDILRHSVIATIRVHNGFCTNENIRSGDKLEFFLFFGGNIPIFNVDITRSQQ
ncbi:hypothetical protein ACFE04_021427 [Oxalis oulophora]